MITATIITIGDELLIGQVIDTNSAWMAQQLNEAGIGLKRRVAVGDDKDAIIQTLNEEKRTANIILITGGLGPTSDDITKPVLCEYFGGKLVTHHPTLDYIKNLFTVVLKRPLTERNILQAEVPDNCRVLFNNYGSAPGMWFEEAGKVFISMPGVPHEMKGMMTDTVLPALKDHFKVSAIAHRTLLTAGVGESFIADMIADFELALPSNIKIAYLPNFGLVRLRLTGYGASKQKLDKELDQQFAMLQTLVKDHMVTNTDQKMEQVVARLLLDRKKTLCTAESCTGGYIAHLITSHAGASAYYEGSVISYSYSAKELLLSVNKDELEKHGAVSEKIVTDMARNALSEIHADYVIAVSGIMGPDGGTPDKPVGTVWMAAGNANRIVAKKLKLRFDRQKNIEVTAVSTLNLLRECILNDAPSD